LEKLKFTISFLLFFICGTPVIKAQVITCVWTRKIDRQKIEVKIILNGGSLRGTSCYYESPDNYLRYSIKGYFDPGTNEAVWWDDQLTEETGPGSPGGKTPLLSRAQFNFPGYGRFMLGRRVRKVDNQNDRGGEVNPGKTDWSNFTDEWDFVLDNFTVEAHDPGIIDSVDLIAAAKKTIEVQPVKPLRKEEPVISIPEPTPAQIEFSKPDSTIIVLPVDSIQPSAIEQIYTARKKVFATEIPVSGDSVELHFYDNAQVDGDSISLFLNGKLIFEHIRLTDKAYSIKLAVTELKSSNELVMVAENEGFIPPNTSYMVANVGDKRYEARLESTQGSSALVLLVKPTDNR
jgi:hypothetical protein